MSTIKINSLGLGAAKIVSDQATIYIDAFVEHESVKPFRLEQTDVLLVTHDDGDHFSPKKTAQAALETGAMVVGPPSIAYPLLAHERLPPEQLQVVYPVHFKQPVTREVRGISLKVYQTQHFFDWHPVHVSYLIRIEGKKLYHTGDSAMIDADDQDLQNLDVLMYNLVKPEKDLAQVDVLEDAYTRFQPRYLVPTHVLGCDWTFSIPDLKTEVERRGLDRVVILEHEQHVLEIV